MCFLFAYAVVQADPWRIIRHTARTQHTHFNPLNAELNPIRHLLALVGARHIVHVSRIRVNHTVTSVTGCMMLHNSAWSDKYYRHKIVHQQWPTVAVKCMHQIRLSTRNLQLLHDDWLTERSDDTGCIFAINHWNCYKIGTKTKTLVLISVGVVFITDHKNSANCRQFYGCYGQNG